MADKRKNLLLKSQRNEVYEMIAAHDLDPANFYWGETESTYQHMTLVSYIAYKNTDFYFKFDYSEENLHFCVYSPGIEKQIDSEYPGSWECEKGDFSAWLQNIYREINQPDLWSELSKYQLATDTLTTSELGNDPFTAYQADQISESLNQIRAYLHEHQLVSDEHIEFVKQKLTYLEEAARRQGRMDWLHTAIGVIMTIAVALSLDPDRANDIWNIIKTTISGFVKLLQ